MGSEWAEGTLGDVAKVQSGFAFKSGDMGESGHPVIKIKNINPPDVDVSDVQRVPASVIEANPRIEKFRLDKGDILIAMTGATVGKVGRMPTVAEPHYLNQRVGKVFVTDENAANEDYVYYVLSQDGHVDQMFDLADGSAQANISGKQIESLEIPLPPLPEQKAIAHILGTWDDKIELNRRMNATLEGMAQALFKSWFVDFDPVIDNALAAGNPIPDELAPRAEVRKKALANGTTQQGSLDHPTLSDPKSLFPAAFQFTEELGWIPEGWEVRAIGDSFQLLGGHSFKSGDYVEDGQFGIVTIKNVQDGNFVQECSNSITEVPAKMKTHCHLRSGDVLLSLTGNVGRVCVVSEGDYLLNQRVSKIVGRDGIPDAFSYFFFRQESLYERMITIAKGTAQQNLSPIETAKLEQVMPSNQTIAALGQQLTEFHAKMVGNTAQSQTLTKLRDTLLPQLIAGELRLSEDAPLTH
jgi:type I restriction enzyme S subunit